MSTLDASLRPTEDDTVVRGERIRLRRKRLADAANDYAWRTDPELARYDAAQPLRLDFADFVLIYSEDLRHANPLRRTFAIEDEQGRHIGNIMYYNIDHRRKQAELGITIGERSAQGRGYGADAVRSLLRHVFEETDLRRVYLNTLSWNERAQRAFKRAGFRPCGKEQREGYDFVVMEVHRDEFLASNGDGSDRIDGPR